MYWLKYLFPKKIITRIISDGVYAYIEQQENGTWEVHEHDIVHGDHDRNYFQTLYDAHKYVNGLTQQKSFL